MHWGHRQAWAITAPKPNGSLLTVIHQRNPKMESRLECVARNLNTQVCKIGLWGVWRLEQSNTVKLNRQDPVKNLCRKGNPTHQQLKGDGNAPGKRLIPRTGKELHKSVAYPFVKTGRC